MRIKKFSILIQYPLCIDFGGGRNHIQQVIATIKNLENEINIEYLGELKFTNTDIDFNILIVFGFTHHNPEILLALKKKGIRIIIIPIFDRLNRRIFYKNILPNIRGIVARSAIRKEILDISDLICCNSESEKEDLLLIFNVNEEKIFVNYLGVYKSEDCIRNLTLDKTLIYKSIEFVKSKYNLEDFLFYPSAKISKRKNQVNLIKKLGNFKFNLVLTGGSHIEDKEKKRLNKIFENRYSDNIKILNYIDSNDLEHMYRASLITLSSSKSETAGLANLEALANGAILIVSDIPPFREYLGKYAHYIPLNKLENYNTKITEILSGKNIVKYKIDNFENVKNHLLKFTWDKYILNLFKNIEEKF